MEVAGACPLEDAGVCVAVVEVAEELPLLVDGAVFDDGIFFVAEGADGSSCAPAIAARNTTSVIAMRTTLNLMCGLIINVS